MNDVVTLLNEGRLLMKCLKFGILNMHSLSFYEIDRLLDVGMLDPVAEGGFNTVELAFLYMCEGFIKQTITIAVKIYCLFPFLEAASEINCMEPCKLVGEDSLPLCHKELFTLGNTLQLICRELI